MNKMLKQILSFVNFFLNVNRQLLGIIFILLCTVSCNTETKQTERSPDVATTPIISYSVKNTLPHDTLSFTEGLLVYNGQLVESTGSPDELIQTQSQVGVVDVSTGRIDVKARLDRQTYFGEGIAILNGKLYQLTYKNKTGFIYDARTYRRIGQFSFDNNEGWGLTTDGRYLIMSDGTPTLTYLSPDSLRPVRTLNVSENGVQIDKLNELEYINGHLYANIWNTNTIVKIDTRQGNVVGRMDLSSLMNDAKIKHPRSLEMNGIAYDSTRKTVYVTGKMWPSIYELEFAH